MRRETKTVPGAAVVSVAAIAVAAVGMAGGAQAAEVIIGSPVILVVGDPSGPDRG